MHGKRCLDEIWDTLHLKHKTVKYSLWLESEMGDVIQMKPALYILRQHQVNDGQYRKQYHT
jgi:hypothetical protein